MGDQRYTSDEVSEIVAAALRRRETRDGAVDHDTLIETASELGLGREEVEAVLAERAESRQRDEAFAVWTRRQRAEFREHLVAFVFVNLFLVAVDLLTPGGSWAYWVILAWGLGLAFHWYETMYPDEDEIEKGIRKTLQRMPEATRTANRRPAPTCGLRLRAMDAFRTRPRGR